MENKNNILIAKILGLLVRGASLKPLVFGLIKGLWKELVTKENFIALDVEDILSMPLLKDQ